MWTTKMISRTTATLRTPLQLLKTKLTDKGKTLALTWRLNMACQTRNQNTRVILRKDTNLQLDMASLLKLSRLCQGILLTHKQFLQLRGLNFAP